MTCVEPTHNSPALMRVLHWTMAAMVLTQASGLASTMVASLADYRTLVSIHRPLGAAILVLVDRPLAVRRAEFASAVPTHDVAPGAVLAASASEYTIARLDVRAPAVGLEYAVCGMVPDHAVRLRPLAVHPAARRHCFIRDLAEDAHGPGSHLLFLTILAHFRGDLVPRADRPGWNAVTDGAMERSARREVASGWQTQPNSRSERVEV